MIVIEYVKFHNPIEFKTGSFSEDICLERNGISEISFDGHVYNIKLGDSRIGLSIPASSVAFARVRHVEDKKVSSSKGTAKIKTKNKKKV